MLRIMMLCLLLPIVALADPNGKTGVTSTSSSGCGSCHGGNAGASVAVSLQGPRTMKPGEKADFAVIVGHSTARSAGLSIAVRLTPTGTSGAVGTLSVASSGSGLRVRNPGSGQEITQSTPKAMSGGSTTFAFSWTAPTSPGKYYVQGVANAVNGDGNESDADDWTFMQPVEVIVENPTSVTENLSSSLHVYPNPLTSDQMLHLDTELSGVMSVRISNASGLTVVDESMNIDDGRLPRPLAELTPGVYAVVITNGTTSRRGRFVVR